MRSQLRKLGSNIIKVIIQGTLFTNRAPNSSKGLISRTYKPKTQWISNQRILRRSRPSSTLSPQYPSRGRPSQFTSHSPARGKFSRRRRLFQTKQASSRGQHLWAPPSRDPALRCSRESSRNNIAQILSRVRTTHKAELRKHRLWFTSQSGTLWRLKGQQRGSVSQQRRPRRVTVLKSCTNYRTCWANILNRRCKASSDEKTRETVAAPARSDRWLLVTRTRANLKLQLRRRANLARTIKPPS